MFTLRTATSNADLEQWRQVRLAVVPGERADSVAEMRASDSPSRLLLLAEDDGVLVGSGVADALERSTLAWAAGHGIAEVYTWTQQGNARMRAVNERLGYRYGIVSIRFESPLPLDPS